MGDQVESPGEYKISSSLMLQERHTLTNSHNSHQCAMGIYPFMFGSIKDFEPVVEGIVQVRWCLFPCHAQ